jgi:hypothetical protein
MKLLVSLGIGIYLLTAGVSYTVFSFFQPGVKQSTVTTQTNKSGKNNAPVSKYAGLPKTESCPLNGSLYSTAQKSDWEKRRPLGVMIENTKEARPQSGLSLADVVYEAVAEGGVTRFLAVYYCNSADIVGPVRSARTYYLDWISEYGSSPLYAHVGGANTPGPADALGQISRYGWEGYNDLNQFSIGFPTFWRDYDRLGKDTATEHTVYTSSEKLWSFAAAKRLLTNEETDDVTGKVIHWDKSFIAWTFKDDAAIEKRPATFAAQFSLSGVASSYANDFVVKWQYDRDSNSYLRFGGGVAQQDLNFGTQLTAKNVIILFQSMGVADDGYSEEGHGSHTLYGNKGSEKAKFLIDGVVTDGTWAKKTRIDRTRFYDITGMEIKLNRGQIWIEILPIGQQVTVS